MINRDRIVKNFIEMAKISSPSYKERNIADYILKEIDELGIKVYEDSSGEKVLSNSGNIIITLKGRKNKKILLSAHMDTVNPCEDIVPIIENGIIKTNGNTVLGADDKAGIAAIIEMIKVIKEEKINHPDIIIVFSVAEETGLHGAKNIDLSKFGKIDYGYILDAGGEPGICYNQAPYAANGKYKIIGKAAHAGGEPENGINAFVVASQAVSKLNIGRIDESTTCNIGVVSGGIATNIVMPSIEMKFEARSLYEDKLDKLLEETDRIFKETCSSFGAEFINEVARGKTKGYNIDESCDVIQIFKKSSEKLGYNFKVMPSGGGSDTNIYNMRGIPSVNIGTGMENVHSTDEYIKIDSLVKTARLLVELIKNM